ncbi:YbaB/EbfC family nucleoid-associated protein [Actinosynnema sp. NPDC053489]|uniref:YbaB/EbfC family nucleoid-associated protein n=1 Tax=Actinosynnema sp. NPDC053489 TaxID=3363916 RepID=UPI0037C6B693
MSNPFQEQIDQAMAMVRDQRAALRRARDEMRAATATATSRDRLVTVVVGAQGELRDVRFNGTGYRELPPAQLAATVVELAGRARAEMAGRVADAFGPLTGGAEFLRRSMTGGTELDEFLAPLDALRMPGATGRDDGEWADG